MYRFVSDKRLCYLLSRLATNQVQYDIPYNWNSYTNLFEHFFNSIRIIYKSCVAKSKHFVVHFLVWVMEMDKVLILNIFTSFC